MIGLAETRMLIHKIINEQDRAKAVHAIEILLKRMTNSCDAELLIYDNSKQTLYSLTCPQRIYSVINIEGCLGKVFLTKQSEICNHIISHKVYKQEFDNPTGVRLKAQIITPLIDNDNLIAILRISRTIGEPNYTYNDLLSLLSLKSILIHFVNRIVSNISASKQHHADTTHTPSNNIENIENVVSKPKEEKSAQNCQTEKEVLLKEFAKAVHDIRTPANGLQGFLELLEEQIENEQLKSFVISANESAKHISRLVDTILDNTKQAYLQGHQEIHDKVPTLKYFSGIANGFTALFHKKKIHYFIFIDPTIPKEIEIDSISLKRVLINLIGNAYKFTPTKKTVSFMVFWNPKNESIRCTVKDTGIGIEESDKKRIFKAFEQVETAQSEHTGSGLGLTNTIDQIKKLGGKLKFRSKVGEGSEFYFEIPVKIIDEISAYDDLGHYKNRILILTQYTDARWPKFIRQYLIAFGIPGANISIADHFDKNHNTIICFEDKISKYLIESYNAKKIALLLVENRLFSLKQYPELKHIPKISKNTFIGTTLYHAVSGGRRLKVLIIDDNEINISLIKSILASEELDITMSLDGRKGLLLFKEAIRKRHKFDILFIDEHMGDLPGSKVLQAIRSYESLHRIDPIFAVYISGDKEVIKKYAGLHDTWINKPFRKAELKKVIQEYKDSRTLTETNHKG